VAEVCEVSVGSSDGSAEKRFLVEVGCSQWFSSLKFNLGCLHPVARVISYDIGLKCLASCVESSWTGRLHLLGTYDQGMVISR
jgi:hypothetical protein